MPQFENLLSPITIGRLTIPNRLLLSPMGTEMGTPDGHSTPREADYYAARARGGTGLVMTGINFVSNTFDPISPGLPRLDKDDYIPGIRAIAEAVHAEGGLLGLQLTMGLGRNNQYCQTLNMEPRSASDNTWFFDPAIRCKPLTVSEIHQIVKETGDAARRAYEAGVDLIDLHGHTGYLLDQFMSECWNRREDEYGGSVENRCRIAVEAIAAIKENAPGVPVSFRLSVDHRFDGGRKPAESVQIARVLEAAGIDLLLCDDGSYEAMDYVFPPYYLGDDCMVSAAEIMKAELSIPVVACGNITPENGEKLLARGAADMIGIGRGLIADPDIIKKLAAGQADRIRPCIRCNQLCIGNAFEGRALGCAVNALVGQEAKEQEIFALSPAPHSVAIIGAGPAGLEAARVAGLRGHRVDVYEKENRIGGVLYPAATPDFKRELRKMITWWEGELAQLPQVQIHLGVEVTPESPELADADEIIVATGSTPLTPPIPGMDKPIVMDVIDAHLGAQLGARVVVCGGGLSGCDLALELAQDGHDVTLIEMASEVAKDMLPLNRLPLLRDLSSNGVTVLTSTRVVEVTDTGVIVEGDNGRSTIDADTVVAAFGVRANTSVGTALQEAGIAARSAGDCVAPRKVGDAINEGFAVGAAV